MHTIVSVFPEEIKEAKLTVMPPEFVIPAAAKGDISTLVIDDDVITFRYIDEYRGTDRRPIVSKEVSKAIIHDFASAKILTDAEGGPGLFVVDGTPSKDEIKKKYANEIKNAESRQLIWFKRLVDRADDDWNKYKRNIVITNLQRKAAAWLGIKREWTSEISEMKIETCKFCTSPVRPETVVCPICHNILDRSKFDAMNTAPAGVQVPVGK